MRPDFACHLQACTHAAKGGPSSRCRCAFVQLNKHCAEDVHHIAYLPLFYCRTGDGRVFVALFFLAWMGVLFWVMSKVAEDFLVPALEVRAGDGDARVPMHERRTLVGVHPSRGGMCITTAAPARPPPPGATPWCQVAPP